MAGGPYPHLFAPGRIGSLELRNRIVMCPMGDRLANPDGSVSAAHLAYFEARARGGAGLLLLGSVAVSYPAGAYALEQLAISHDRYLAGYTALAERVRSQGARVAVQLVHNGATALNDMAVGRPMIVPSIPPVTAKDRLARMVTAEEATAMGRALARPGAGVRYRVATDDDCGEIVDSFAAAAERAARAGIDGVELHAGHGYLIDAFLSPVSNTRTDRWGGPIANRARLLCEITREIRRRLGAEFPLWARLNAFEAHRPGGTTVEDAIAAARLAVAAGLDAVHVSASADGSVGIGVTDSHTPHHLGALLPAAAAVRRAVDVPVIAFGRLEPDAAEAALAAGAADFVAMGRKLLADPDLPAKLRDGRPEDVRPCIYQYRCIGNISVGRGVRCVVNPATGREDEVAVGRTARARRVLVAGGGPAGLEAARMLAADGHDVALWESSMTLGGRLALAAHVDEPMARLVQWLTQQVTGRRVDVRLGVPATLERCIDGGFECVVVATGSGRPDLDLAVGDEGPVTIRHVDELERWLARDGGEVGARVVVLGGDRGGLAVARRCAERGRRVTVVEAAEVCAADMGLPGRFRAVYETELSGVTLLPGTRLDSIGPDGVRVRDAAGAVLVLAADTAIVVGPTTPRRELLGDLAAAGVEVRAVGDCTGGHGLEAAFADVAAMATDLRC